MAVVTNPDEPVGRKSVVTPPPVKVLAIKHDISVLQPQKFDSAFTVGISDLKPDLFVVAAYGKIIPKEIIEMPKYGALNIHPSLLPRWRGASPVQYSILNGDTETGVTVMLMDEKMDHGPIVTNSKFEIRNSKLTTPELSEILSKMGMELIIETIPKWINGKIKPIPQDETKATYSKILKKEDGRINWSKPAASIERQVRALAPWPGSFTYWKRGEKMVQLKVLEADLRDTEKSDFPLEVGLQQVDGTVIVKNNRLFVKTGSEYLEILKIQPEGKREMTAKEFINGYGDIDGAILQ